MSEKNIKIIRELPIWKDEVVISSLEGGLTNNNYLVKDKAKKLVVRIGEDIPEHHITRSNELISSKAAYEVGIGPKVVFNTQGILVLEYIESQTMTEKDIKNNLDKITSLIKKMHNEMPKKIIGQGIIFWVFHIIRNYSKFLENHNSNHCSILKKLLNCNNQLEKISSPHQIVYCHNDLLPANFLNDGSKIWLIDWEYSGFNNPLFDIGGISSNNNLSNEEEIYILENYYEKKPTLDLMKRYHAMKCSSLLRETMWSMVAEIISKIDFDYTNYTYTNLNKFEKSYKELNNF